MNIFIKNSQRKIRINKKQFESLSKKIAASAKLDKKSIATVIFVDNNEIQKLNRKYLKHNFPTDVLAFNLTSRKIGQKMVIIGDIVINVELAKKNARIYKNSFVKETTLYIIHGMLHLLGFNDYKASDKKLMEKHQEQLLQKVLLKN